MRPVWKWAIGIAASLLVILFLANWYVNYRLKPRLEAQLKERIHDGTDGRYRLMYEELNLSLLEGSATATGIRLVPDTTAQSPRPAAGTTYQARVGRLRISGVGVLRWLLSKKLHIGTIALDTPSVTLLRHPQSDTTVVDTAAASPLAKLTEVVSRIRVNRILLREGRLQVEEQGNAARLQVQGIETTLRDLRINSASLRDSTRLYGAKSIELQAHGLVYLRPDSLYLLQTGPLHFQTDARELTVDSLRYGITVSKAEFYRRVHRAEDIPDIEISRMQLAGIKKASWVNRQLLAAAALHIDSGHIAIYKDKTQPNPPENKIGKSPHQQLLKLEQRLAIDSVSIRGVDVRFTEVSDKTGKAGTVTFDQTDGVFRNVTNDSAALARDRYMRLHARSRVMGTGDLTVDFRFDLLDSLGAHTYSAKLGAMDGTVFNRMITPQLNLEIERVDIKGMRFDMKADDRGTGGTLQLDYDRLNVIFLKEGNDGGMSEKRVFSFLANRFLLNDSNPDANGVRHMGNIYIERPSDFSFFKMIWRSIREGTKECIGLPAP